MQKIKIHSLLNAQNLWLSSPLGLLPSIFCLLAVSSLAANITAQNPTPVTPSATTVNRSTVKLGSKGVEVSQLQAALKLWGYYTGEVNGIYGENTAIAVSRFQLSAGLKPDGIVGAETWNRLFPAASSVATAKPSPDIPSPLALNPQTTAPRPQATTAPNSSTPNSTTTRSNPPKVSTTNPSEQVDLPILKLGMQGPGVNRLQQRLQTLGFFKTKVTGVFDAPTLAAVQAAQKKFKLNPDGIVGPSTWNALLR